MLPFHDSNLIADKFMNVTATLPPGNWRQTLSDTGAQKKITTKPKLLRCVSLSLTENVDERSKNKKSNQKTKRKVLYRHRRSLRSNENLQLNRFFTASRVVAIKRDRATSHPAKHFYAVILMFELLPLVTFKCVIFHVESRNTDVCAEPNVHFCHTISSQRLQQFHSSGMFYTVYLLGVCVGSQRDTD